MIKIQTLFDAYEEQINGTPNVKDIFEAAGMDNQKGILKYGFFPLGSGILTKQSEIGNAITKERGIMILGHDFGTVSYVSKYCKDYQETNSRTIDNLKKIFTNPQNIFFTNFYLGLRIKGKMTDRYDRSFTEYESFCYDFFLKQLEIIKPSLVICLGKEVGFILNRFFENQFSEFKNKSFNYKTFYENGKYVTTSKDELGKRNFFFIPHPSWAHVNWKKYEIKSKIETVLNNLT